jgi:hypothetical protein
MNAADLFEESTTTCPYCGQPIAREELTAIRARIRQAEQKRIGEVKALERARLQKELEEKHGRDLAKARTEERLATTKVKDAEIAKERAQHTRENEALQKKLKDLERQVEKKTTLELGDGPERDLAEVLREAFPEDVIQRVSKGEAGADVIHDVRYRGESCGQILYDSKNRRAWRGEYVTKLREDRSRAGAAHAVLTTVSFPSGEDRLCIQDGVVIVHPNHVSAIVQFLRTNMMSAHRQGLTLKNREGKTAELYAYMSSNEFAQRIKESEDLVDQMSELDSAERGAHERTWKTRLRLVMKLKMAVCEIDTRITEIMEKPEDEPPPVLAAAG